LHAVVIDRYAEKMTPVISLHAVTKMYRMGGETLYALRDLTLTIDAGEFVAVVGPSGSGKSTFANLIGGLDTPTSGTIVVEGKNIAQLRDKALSEYRNKHIGFIFQAFNLQGTKSALANVMLPLMFAGVSPRKRKKRAEACLAEVGLGDRLQHKPGELSGGQRQRVAIARALSNRPNIIIADEPTGNLDTKHGAEIMDVLRSLNKQGITIIIITHDLQIAAQADRTIEIRDGQLVTRGVHAR
jgi:putative ABC transport system ATP-binding protein